MDGDGESPAPTAEQVSALLDGATLLEVRQGQAEFRTSKGQTPVDVTEVDLNDPLTRGMFDLTSGRLPRSEGEVVVNQSVLDKGYHVGDALELTADDAPANPTIVGVAESTTVRDLPGRGGPARRVRGRRGQQHSWLVEGDAVSWATVRQLNGIGAVVRLAFGDRRPAAVLRDPARGAAAQHRQHHPRGDRADRGDGADRGGAAGRTRVRGQRPQAAAQPGPDGGDGRYAEAVPAGDRGRRRGARQRRRGGSGVALGIGAARLLQPLLQSRSDDWFGPFEIPWLHLAGVAGFGMLSAFLAAMVPAHLAAKQDVVAVLAGRRGDRAPSLKSPLLGLVLLGVGIGGAAFGAAQGAGGEFAIAVSAIPAVLGMILLVPMVLALLAKASGRLPLVLRYAVRDANRHRTRTVPAVSAVAATVAGVVALGSASPPTMRRTRRRTSRRSPPESASSLPTTRTSRGRRCAACSTGSCREPP